MSYVQRFARRARNLLLRRRAEADLGDELRFHLEMEAEAIRQQGIVPGVARAEAHRRFGGVDRYAEACRDERGGRGVEAFGQDARYALRVARRFPGFTAIVVLTLASAIGATTAIFSVVNAVLLRPLPFPRSDEIVALYAQNPDKSSPRFNVSWADYLDWRTQTKSFTDIVAFRAASLTLVGDREPERISGLNATRNVFDVLGIHPSLGRGFGPEDERGETSQTVVLTHGFWQRRFAGDSGIIGRSVPFGGRARTVIGVLPPEFQLDGRQIDAITVLAPSSIPSVESHGQHMLEAAARLKPGVSVQQAQEDLADVAARLAAVYPDIAGWSANVFSWHGELVRATRRPLLILLAAAGLVLMIGCVNVANLLVTRGAARGRELALRQALGASRARLVSQLLVESGALALVGGVFGIGIAILGTKGILTLVPAGVIPRMDEVRADATVLGFALGLSVLTALVVGLWPALRATSWRLSGTLGRGGRGGGQATHSPRVRRGLVIAEVSLALVLLVASALVIQSLRNLVGVDLGFRVDRVVTMRLTLSPSSYVDSAQSAFYRNFLARLSARPGIEAAAAANTPPMSGGGINTGIRLIGRPLPSQQLMSSVTAVTPGYFRTMGMRLRGRDVAWEDPEPTLVLSETAARTFWPGEDVIGKRIGFGGNDNTGAAIVGVVADSRVRGPTRDPAPMIYMSYSGASSIVRTMTLVVRGAGETADVVATTKNVLREIDRTLPVFGVRTVRDVVDQFVAQPRLNTTLLGVFAGMALLLAGIGIYGVVSHSVAQRTQELGVRIALGAQRADIVRLVLGEGAVLAVVGVLLGLAAAFAATPLIRSWLFGIGANDPLTLAAVALTLVTIALAASYIPARRATRVDPVLAMRGE